MRRIYSAVGDNDHWYQGWASSKQEMLLRIIDETEATDCVVFEGYLHFPFIPFKLAKDLEKLYTHSHLILMLEKFNGIAEKHITRKD
jgi:hypothetical protein